MDIEGKVAFITGTRRIGRIVGGALGQRGARVALGYRRSRESAEQAAREVRAAGREAMLVQVDLSREEEVGDAVKRITAAWGGVDILVNLASIYASKPFEETTRSDWDSNMNVNLRSAFFCAQAVTPGMKAGGGGRIINWRRLDGCQRPSPLQGLPGLLCFQGGRGRSHRGPRPGAGSLQHPGQRHCPRSDFAAAGPGSGGRGKSACGDAAGPLGWWGTDRSGGGQSDPKRFHHGRMHPDRRRTPHLLRMGSTR